MAWLATPLGLWTLFVTGLAVRLWFAGGGGFPTDIAAFQAWSTKLADTGPGAFYEPGYFADYPPGYLYILWFLGEISKFLFDAPPAIFLVKLPAIVADIALAYVVMRFAERLAAGRGLESPAVRPLAASVILFNPAIIFVSSVWGQADVVAAFYAVAAGLLLVTGERSLKRDVGGMALLALAFATKPQTFFVLPIAAVVLIRRHLVADRNAARGRAPWEHGIGRLAVLAVAFFGVWIALGIPFGKGLTGLFAFYREGGSVYPYTSVWAFNLWGFLRFWAPDQGSDAFAVFGVPALYIGITAFLIGAVFLLIRCWRMLRSGERESEVLMLGAAAFVCLSFAVLTRIHERYLFLGIACLAPFVFFKPLRRFYAGLSLLYLVNLYFPWLFYVVNEAQANRELPGVFEVLYGNLQDSPQKKLLSLVTALVCLGFVWRFWDLLKASAADLKRSSGVLSAAASDGGLRRTALAPGGTPGAREAALAPAVASGATDSPAEQDTGARGSLALHPIGRRGAALAGAVFLIVLPTRLLGLASPPGMYFDEIYHARTAGEYLEGKEVYEWTHPPLGKELMALSLNLFADFGVEKGAPLPEAMSASSIVDAAGDDVAWTEPRGSQLQLSTIADGCSLSPPSTTTPLVLRATAVAATEAGAFVGGNSEAGPVVARYVGAPQAAESWTTTLRATPVDLAAAGESVYVVDEAGNLTFVDYQGHARKIDQGARHVVSDGKGGVWVSYPRRSTVSAFGADGVAIASVPLNGTPGEIAVAVNAERVLVHDEGTNIVESVDTSQNARVDQLSGIPVQQMATVPANGLLYIWTGSDLKVVEPRGLAVLGDVELGAPPIAFGSNLEGTELAALTSEGVVCVSGNNTFAWRLPGAVFGSLLPALVFLLALRVSGSVLAAVLGAVFMSLEGLSFTISRIALLDSYVTAFIVLAWLAALSVLWHTRRVDEGESNARRVALTWLVGCGVALGLGLASKWVALYGFGGVFLLFVFDAAIRRRRGVLGLLKNPAAAGAVVAGTVLVVPFVIYVASYIPYFALDHNFRELVTLQRSMFEYHANLTADHPYGSPWYGWPVGHKAVALYTNTVGTDRGDIVTVANPVVLIGGFLSLVIMAVVALRRRAAGLAAIVAAGLFQFLPWATVPRVVFLYHYAPVVPFLAVALGWALAVWRKGSSWRSAEIGFVVVAAFLVFGLTLPELDAWYVSPDYHTALREWLPWLF